MNDKRQCTPLRDNIKLLLGIFFVNAIAGISTWLYYLHYFQANPAEYWGGDFEFYYGAAQAFLKGIDIYSSRGFPYGPNGVYTSINPYLYPPPSIYLFLPFTFLSFEQALTLITAGYIALLLGTVFLLVKILHHYGIQVSKRELILIGVAISLFAPATRLFLSANLTLAFPFLVALFYYFLIVKKRLGISGIILGTASILKVWPAILVLLGFLYERSRQLVLTTIATIVVLCGVAIWLQGISAFREFIAGSFYFQNFELEMTKNAILSTNASQELNVSITSTVLKLVTLLGLNFSAASLVIDIAKVVFFGGIFLFLYKVSKSGIDASKLKEWEILSFSLLVVAVVFVAANVTENTYVYFLIPSFILLVYAIPLMLREKIVLGAVLVLFSLEDAIYVNRIISVGSLFGNGTATVMARIVPAQTIAYVLLVSIILYLIRERNKSGYWGTPAR